MAENFGYYKDESDSGRHKGSGHKNGSLLLKVLDVLVVVVTFVGGVALLLALLSKWISPQHASVLAFLGLFYPIIYIVNCICGLWWAIRWRKLFFVSLAVLLMGFGNLKLFYHNDLRKEYSAPPRGRDEITLVSFNVMNFSAPDDSNGVKCYDAIINFLNERRVAIVCMQEAYFSQSFDVQQLKERLSGISYSHHVNSSGSGEHGSGLVILSTYPIVRNGIVQIDSTSVRSIWSDLKIGRDTVRVVCNHLQSTAIDQEDMHTTLTPQIMEDTLAREKLMVVGRKMARNYRARAEQAELLHRFVEESPYRTIVCGDFNDTPVSYAVNKVSSGMQDAFVECGRGTCPTFKGFWNLFRIDYVLLSDGLAVKHYSSFDLEMSDHRPVEVGFEIENTPDD
ncbi:MAG: endonuclease/exonuclease/phosphatase family protein [Tidjanibacter sp.]|nr:endonuclease/exonuclease/phosphatase family protein [Tidjanibacter sp.]